MINKTFSIVIDNELNGFEDDQIIDRLNFINEPTVITNITFTNLGIKNIFGQDEEVTIAYDDILIITDLDIVPSQDEPDSSLITLPPDGQLKDVTGNGVYATRPTVVITHGWNFTGSSQIPAWIQTMGNEIDNKADVNILWWDWLEQAESVTSASWGKAASNAPTQGAALAESLLINLGFGYDQTVHFIGHSMGARVNRQAVNDIH
jgi:hypothetical protein